jgi:hypothetical protein
MAKSCDDCFYEAQKGTVEPCRSCGSESQYSNYVSVNFLKDVPDDTSSLEGQYVMDQMIAHLERVKPSKKEDNLDEVFEQLKRSEATRAAFKSSRVTQGVKYDSDKLQWTLLPFRAINEVLEVLAFGAKKYAADNWKIVPEARTRYVDAAFRHLSDWHLKERLDGETGKSHLAHAICCLLFLLWFEQEDRV